MRTPNEVKEIVLAQLQKVHMETTNNPRSKNSIDIDNKFVTLVVNAFDDDELLTSAVISKILNIRDELAKLYFSDAKIEDFEKIGKGYKEKCDIEFEGISDEDLKKLFSNK